MNSAPSVGLPRSEELRGADTLGRLQWEPLEWLEVGAHGGHKIVDHLPGGPLRHLNAFGGDVRIKGGGFRFVLESMYADNPSPPRLSEVVTSEELTAARTAPAAVVIGYLRYNAKLLKPLTLQPVVALEWADTDLDVSQDEAARGVVGLNFLIGKHLRVMPQVEIVRPLGTVSFRSEPERESYYLLITGEI